MTFELDTSDLTRLAVDLETVQDGAQENLHKAVQVTSRHVKDAWNDKLYNDGHARRTRGTISYDTEVTRDTIEAEIGPYRSRVQSGIVKLLETGSVNNPPHGYGAAALHENEADLVRGIEKALGDAAAKAGL